MTIKKQQAVSNRNEVKQPSRRKVMTVAASTAVVAGAALPSKWAKPVVDSVLLPAHAQTSATILSATIDAAQEVPTPVVATMATGTATVTVNQSDNTIQLTGTVMNLTGDAQMAHIHGPAARGATAPVLQGLSISGNAASTTISFSGAVDPSTITAILDGMTYINIHTVANMPGEVRGQIEI